MIRELKDCPFCGSDDLTYTGKIYCSECGASAEIEKWNTRTDAKYRYNFYENWAGYVPEPTNESEAMIIEISELAFEAARELK